MPGTEKVAIKVSGVGKTFKLPHEKTTSIKSAVVNFRNRKKTYEKQQVLKDITFEIKEGEFFGILGRNGSGKSTLLKLLAGIYSPSSGDIAVNGKLTPFIELGVGFNPELSGRENVFLNGALLGFSRKEMLEKYDDIVKFAELEKFMDQKLKNYSSGMQVRLAFSIAIRAQTDILLLDEVLAVGDAAFQQKCYDYFEDLKRQKKTVVFVSHDMSAVRRFCSEAIYIKDGSIIGHGSAIDIADLYVTENIGEEPTNTEKGPKLSAKHSLKGKVTQVGRNVTIDLTYSTRDSDEVYVGLSVIRDGFSVAEIATAPQLKLGSQGMITYTLDTSILNAGVYNLTAALFKRRNRELIAISKHDSRFTIKGSDITRGSALKLPDTWVLTSSK
jgi:ABC-2 type transport system ATP-binding protein